MFVDLCVRNSAAEFRIFMFIILTIVLVRDDLRSNAFVSQHVGIEIADNAIKRR